MITLLATLFGVWYRFTLICIYACNQSHLKIQPQIKSASLLSKQQSIDTAPFHKHAQARKRLRTDPHTAVSDLGAPSQDKRSKESSSPWLPVSTPNKEQQLARLPNTLYFKSLKLKIKHDPNSPLAESILEKLDAFHKLKLPYTFLSSTLRSCTHLHILDTLLNKTLMKSAKGRYAIETKLQHILNNNIKLSNLSSMVSGSGNTAAQAFETLVNRLTGQEMLHKIQTLKHLGITPSNLSSMVSGSGNRAAQAFETVINRLTDQEMLHKIQTLKHLGITPRNLSSMVNGAGNAAAQAFETVISRLTDQEMLHKIQTLQHLGITPSNLSSMVSGSGNRAAQAFETVVNRLTDQEMLHKIQTLQHLGITPSNLSSMVNGSGNTAAQAFETVINRLTDQETVHKIEILKKQGIQFNHLSAMLAKSATKASDALINVIDLLNNDQYIETMQKVTAELYSKSDVINQNDAILVSRQASIVLHGIGNLKKQPSIIDPSNHPKFKRFLTDCYNNNKYVDDRLMEIKKVTDDDSRIELHGQDKVVAKKKIIKGTVLGIYTGILLCDEALDNAVELAYLSTKNIYGLNKLNSYSFYLDLVTPTPLYLSACGRGNMLIKINANQTYSRTSTQSSRSNVTASWNSCDGHTPFILFYATEHIPATQELLFDYGKQYWDHHGNNNDLSNPDAQIYRALLSTKKYLDQASSIRFLRLIQAHDHDLYRNLLTHLMTPIHTFSGKDRLVECRNLFSFTKQQRDYRIYKLPGEKSSAAAPEDYFSINWDPAVSLDALDQYNWSGA